MKRCPVRQLLIFVLHEIVTHTTKAARSDPLRSCLFLCYKLTLLTRKIVIFVSWIVKWVTSLYFIKPRYRMKLMGAHRHRGKEAASFI